VIDEIMSLEYGAMVEWIRQEKTEVKNKAKPSLHSPGQALRVPGG
jgi:hypothetical protein